MKKHFFINEQMVLTSFRNIFNHLEFKSIFKIANVPRKRDPVPFSGDPIKALSCNNFGFFSFERREKNLC